MMFQYRTSLAGRLWIYASLLAIGLGFSFPIPAQAQAILLASNPARDAILVSAPGVVSMLFSENLNPTFSTAAVVNSANHRVDLHDAQLSSDDAHEMDISLEDSVPSDVYVVIWQTQSADDGQIQRGSFVFKVMASNGKIPFLKGKYPGQNVLGGGNTTMGLDRGQLDGPTLFNLIMITLADLSAIFWVGTQLWRTFVSQSPNGDSAEQYAIDQSANRSFEVFFSIPTLLIIFLANLGVLVGQGLFLTRGNIIQVFPLLIKLLDNSRFGMLWTIGEIIVVLAIAIAVYILWSRQRSPILNYLISWIHLALGLALLTTMALSSHAEAASSNILLYAVLADWLHLLAASLWIGGTIYLIVVYIPGMKRKSQADRTQALLTTLSHFLPLVIAGIVIMAITGPFNATIHMNTLGQLMATVYGRVLLVKILCVGVLLVISAIHILLFYPGLKRTFAAYQTAQPESQEIKVLTRSVTRQTRQLTRLFYWEALFGLLILICTSSMNLFTGTLQPMPEQQNQPRTIQQIDTNGEAFNTTTSTTDGTFRLKLTITPNVLGSDLFIVNVLDSNGKPDPNVSVSFDLAMVDMNMGIESVNLQPNGKGEFSAKGDISMDGNWAIRLNISTSDSTLHQAIIKFSTLH